MKKRIMTFVLAALVLSAVFAVTAQAKITVGDPGVPMTGDDNSIIYIIVALMTVSIVGVGLVIYSFIAGRHDKHDKH